jgi:hypothetical protein
MKAGILDERLSRASVFLPGQQCIRQAVFAFLKAALPTLPQWALPEVGRSDAKSLTSPNVCCPQFLYLREAFIPTLDDEVGSLMQVYREPAE